MIIPEGEFSPQDQLLQKYNDFINRGMEFGLLRGYDLNPEKEIDEENIVYGDFAGIYFHENFKERRKVETISKTHTTEELLDMILKVKFPKEFRQWQDIVDSMTLSKKEESSARLSDKALGMPHAIIAFGRDKYTDENVATMFTVVGISPIKAFKEIKLLAYREKMSRKASSN